jgi:transposase
MAFFTIAKKKGKEYLCLEDRARIDGKVRRTLFKYIGPREKFPHIPLGKINGKVDALTSDSFDTKSYEFGISAALWSLAQELRLPQIIDEVLQERQSPNLSSGEYLILAAINRIADPGSKSHLSAWFQESWLSTRIHLDPEILNAQTYWNLFHRINPAQMEAVEIAFGKCAQKHLGIPWDHLLYDTTNFFTYSKSKDPEDIRRTGHSKQSRSNLLIVNFFLLCSKPWGIPLLHESYAGNIQDAKEFKLIPEKVTNYLQGLEITPEKITLFFDKGNLSPAAFELLDQHHLHFIASLRPSMAKDLLHIPREGFTRTIIPHTQKEVEYYRLNRNLYGQDRAVVVIIDPANEAKHRFEFEIALQKKETALNTFQKTQLNVKKWRDPEKVARKLKALIGKSPWKEIITAYVSGDFDQVQVQITINSAETQKYRETFGRTLIFTNQISWSVEDLIWAYREQYLIEHAFKAMKNPDIIAIRPIYVSSKQSIEGHIFICVLALFLMALLRYKLAKKRISLSYDQLQTQLKQIRLNKIIPHSETKPFYKIEKIPAHCIKLVKLLHLERLFKEIKAM